MELIGARLRYRVDLAARSPGPARGAHTAGLHLELLQCIRKRHWHRGPVIPVVVHRPIQGIHHAEILSTGYGDERTGRCSLIPALGGGFSRLDCSARERDQVGDLPPLQRQLQNSLILHNLTHCRASRVHE